MTPRFLEVAFRNKVLLLIPIALGLALGIAAFVLDDSETYVSQATVWVEQPSDFSGASIIDYNQYATPAQNQAAAMRELLSTKSFVTGVLDEVDGPPPGESRHPNSRYVAIRQDTSIIPSGTHVLFIQYSAADPMEAKNAITAIVGEYAKLYKSQVEDRAQRASSFYESELSDARNSLETASAAVRQYVSDKPELLDVDLADPPASALRDLEFARLVVAEQTARDHYNSVLDNYTASQLAASTANDTNPNFTVLDEPEVPTAPVPVGQKTILLQPIAGLVLGSFVAAAIWLLRWRQDQAIRLPSDLAFLSQSIPLTTLPALRSRRRRWPKSFVRLAAALHSGLKGPLPETRA